LKIENCKLKIISDYAHHPTEIKLTLKSAREKFPKRKIWVIFQPHQYQRTYYLFSDFVKVFQKAPIDRLIIVDVYDVAGREEREIKKKVNSKKLIEVINKPWAIYIPSIKETVKYLKKHLRGKEVIMIVGAGDIYKLVDFLS
jgi:UDP-N-acetylmuramate--alanine ligase